MTYLSTNPAGSADLATLASGSLPLDPHTFTRDRRPADVLPNMVVLDKLQRRGRPHTFTRENDPWTHEPMMRGTRR